MPDLNGQSIFISASFPSGERGREFEPYDAAAIADAVTALLRAVFVANGRIVFGGHPTITPLVLLVAAEHGQRGTVDIYQSRWFEGAIPEETGRLEQAGFGRIHWTEKGESLKESLTTLRRTMLETTQPVLAAFIGGMDGLFEEWDLVGASLPGCIRVPFSGPGGASAELVSRGPVPDKLRDLVASRQYPLLAHRTVALALE